MNDFTWGIATGAALIVVGELLTIGVLWLISKVMEP